MVDKYRKLTYISSHAGTGISSHHDTFLKYKGKSCGSLCWLHHPYCFSLKPIKLKQPKNKSQKVTTRAQHQKVTTIISSKHKKKKNHISSNRKFKFLSRRNLIAQCIRVATKWGWGREPTKINLHHFPKNQSTYPNLNKYTL